MSPAAMQEDGIGSGTHPSPGQIFARRCRIWSEATATMRDGRAELDDPPWACPPRGSLPRHRVAPMAGPDCRALYRHWRGVWRRQTGRVTAPMPATKSPPIAMDDKLAGMLSAIAGLGPIATARMGQAWGVNPDVARYYRTKLHRAGRLRRVVGTYPSLFLASDTSDERDVS